MDISVDERVAASQLLVSFREMGEDMMGSEDSKEWGEKYILVANLLDRLLSE
jgi:hypothetical protein